MSSRPPLLPVLSALGGIATFSVMDAVMKSGSTAVGAFEAMLLRAAWGVALMLPIWWLRGGRVPEWPVLRLHLTRGAVGAVMAATFFWGLVRTPMATGMALSFIAPLIALFLAALVLKEPVGPRAWQASLLGLAGVGVIAWGRLGENAGGTASHGAALAGVAAILLSALLYAWNLILQRQQAQVARPDEVALSQFLFGGLVLLPVAPFVWVAPAPHAVWLIGGGAALAAVSLMLLGWAYARAETQWLVPIEYSAFPWSALMGRLWFGEALTAPTVGGAILIVAGCWWGTRGHAPDHVEQTSL
ncbi:MAG: DMT family transporter [Proteobacteria bacterium]|nr:DMT family transporter [Pseudomonadota bacterium]